MIGKIGKKNNRISAGNHYTTANTNNVHKIWALLLNRR